jgi:hypothetical protein
VQVAEFDIAVSGRVGTSDVSVLIECRDRPTEGAAPGAWIEQLVGRRLRFRFDKVMAVSSTGFSPGAVDAARDGNVELRHMGALTPDEVANWLPGGVPLVVHNHELTAVRVLCEEGAGDDGEPTSRRFRLDDQVLVDRSTGTRTSIKEIWQRVVGDPAVWRRIALDAAAVEQVLRAEDYLAERYCLDIEGRLSPITSIEFVATLQAVVPKMRLVELSGYSPAMPGPKGAQAFAHLARWKSEGLGPVAELTIIGFLKRDEHRDAT